MMKLLVVALATLASAIDFNLHASGGAAVQLSYLGPKTGSASLHQWSVTGPLDRWFCFMFGGQSMSNGRGVCYTTGKGGAVAAGSYEYTVAGTATASVNRVTSSNQISITSTTTTASTRTINFEAPLKWGLAFTSDVNPTSLQVSHAVPQSATLALGYHGFGSQYRRTQSIDISAGTTPQPTAAVVGDPHYTTLDGLRYTFNGIGEYYLAKAPRFEAHVKTHVAGDDSAAVFGIGFRYRDTRVTTWWNGTESEHVVVIKNNELIGLQSPVYADEELVTRRTQRGNEGSLRLELPTLPGFALTLNFGGYRSSFYLETPASWAGKTTGLLGNNNGDARDDLTSPEGRTLWPEQATMKQIHFEFGTKWNVPMQNSLFEAYSYTWQHDQSKFRDASYVPNFAPEFVSADHRREAEAVCQGDSACLYDAASTGNLDYARRTLEDGRAAGMLMEAGSF